MSIDSLRVAILRAKLNGEDRWERELRTLLNKKTSCKERIARAIIGIFAKYVGNRKTCASFARDMNTFATCDEDELPRALQIIRDLLAVNWAPFLCAWHQSSASASAPRTITKDMILGGDISILSCYGDIVEEMLAQYEALHELRDLPHWIKECEEMREFIVLSLLRTCDPVIGTPIDIRRKMQCTRGMCIPQPLVAIKDCQRNTLVDIELLLIRACEYSMYAAGPRAAAGRLVDENRARLRIASRAEEDAARAEMHLAPLFIGANLPVIEKDNISTIAILRDNIHIGFDGVRRVIISSYDDEKIVRASLSLALLARAAKVPRNNGEVTVVWRDGYIIVNECNMRDIPSKIPRPEHVLHMWRDRTDLVRAYIMNCMWRFVMNFPGRSASECILAIDEQIYAYNEHKISDSRRNDSSVHSSIAEEFARDIDFYRGVAQKWVAFFAHLANNEYAIADEERSIQCGITCAQLNECAKRAAKICECWTGKLKNDVKI